ncbi:serine protease 53-like [Ascaphus truei]|uniref:serine protease 53-like n=1 Tax=Ascaphus truei TaxID=8439 RepID=UPI003F5A15D1
MGTLSSDSPFDWSVVVAPGSPAMREFPVQRISLHGAYISQEEGKDAALLQLTSPITLGPYTQPACLPRTSHRLLFGSTCWHTGWDRPHPNGKVGPPRGVKLELIGPNECNCIYSRPNSANHSVSILPGMVCASYKEEEGSECLSDSGGPLVCMENGTWFLVGVRSFGEQCKERVLGGATSPGVYTQLNAYEDWISRVTMDASFNLQIQTPPSELDSERCSYNSPKGCGSSVTSPGSALVGDAVAGAWPWQVSVQQYGFHACSGVLITETWVLTAAHCVSRVVSMNDFSILLGRQHEEGDNPHQVSRRVKRVVPHPSYTRTSGDNNLALVEMYYGVTFSDYILPICLPPPNTLPPPSGCRVTGWGDLHPSASPPDEVSPSQPLRELAVSLLDRGECGGQRNERTPLCAAVEREGSFTCLEDLTVPLVCQLHPGGPWALFGISSSSPTSLGHVCPGNYTPVSSQLSWISEVVPKKDLGLWESNTTTTAPEVQHGDTVTSFAPWHSTTERPQDVYTMDTYAPNTTGMSPYVNPTGGARPEHSDTVGMSNAGHSTTSQPHSDDSTRSSQDIPPTQHPNTTGMSPYVYPTEGTHPEHSDTEGMTNAGHSTETPHSVDSTESSRDIAPTQYSNTTGRTPTSGGVVAVSGVAHLGLSSLLHGLLTTIYLWLCL